jgi:hypothetical protein
VTGNRRPPQSDFVKVRGWGNSSVHCRATGLVRLRPLTKVWPYSPTLGAGCAWRGPQSLMPSCAKGSFVKWCARTVILACCCRLFLPWGRFLLFRLHVFQCTAKHHPNCPKPNHPKHPHRSCIVPCSLLACLGLRQPVWLSTIRAQALLGRRKALWDAVYFAIRSPRTIPGVVQPHLRRGYRSTGLGIASAWGLRRTWGDPQPHSQLALC